MQLRFKSALFTLPSLALLLLSACGGQVVPTSSEGKGASCADACEEAVACDKTVDQDDCVESCTEDETVSLAGQEAIAKCSAKQDCQPANALPTLACILNEISDVEVSATGKTFCNGTLDRLNECQLAAPTDGETPAPTSSEDCEDYVALVADEFLTDLNACAEKTNCQSVQTCFGLAVLANIDLAALQNPKPGDPGLVGLLGGLFGGAFEIPGGIPGQPDGEPPEPGDSEPGTGGSTAGTGSGSTTGGNPGLGGAGPVSPGN